MNHIRKSVNTKTLFILYYSLVQPYISYGIILWGKTFQTHLSPLFILQKRALRVITSSHKRTHTKPLFERFQILPLYQSVIFSSLIFVHKYFYRPYDIPTSFQYYFTRQTDIHHYQTRGYNFNFQIPLFKSNLSLNTLKISGPREWNKLPLNLKSIQSASLFKKKLRYYLLHII